MAVTNTPAPGTKLSMRLAYGEALVALGHANPDVVVLSADVQNSDHSYMFEDAFPDRFFNVGISEQSLVDVAVGLANGGYIPFANTFAFLFATRAVEMIRTHLSYGGANVKLMGAYGGISDSFDGPTHHSNTDLAILRSLPRMTVIVPGDTTSVTKMLPAVAAHQGPVYVRLNRNEVPLLYGDDFAPTIGKAHQVQDGKDLTIIACGLMVSRAMEASDVLRSKGLDARVLDMHTVKPIDVDAVTSAARQTGAIVTVEEHTVLGGLGGAVAEVASEVHPVPIRRVGLADRFAETGPYDRILDAHGMSIDAIVSAAQAAVDAKKS